MEYPKAKSTAKTRDIVFCVDCSSGMRDYLDMLKQSLEEFISELATWQRLDFRLRLIGFGHRQECQAEPFTESGDVSQFCLQLNALSTGTRHYSNGYGLEALYLAASSGWRNCKRYIAFFSSSSDSSLQIWNTYGLEHRTPYSAVLAALISKEIEALFVFSPSTSIYARIAREFPGGRIIDFNKGSLNLSDQLSDIGCEIMAKPWYWMDIDCSDGEDVEI